MSNIWSVCTKILLERNSSNPWNHVTVSNGDEIWSPISCMDACTAIYIIADFLNCFLFWFFSYVDGMFFLVLPHLISFFTWMYGMRYRVRLNGHAYGSFQSCFIFYVYPICDVWCPCWWWGTWSWLDDGIQRNLFCVISIFCQWCILVPKGTHIM